MLTGPNGFTLPTQSEFERMRREKRGSPNPQKTQTRRNIEAILERRALDAQLDYLK